MNKHQSLSFRNSVARLTNSSPALVTRLSNQLCYRLFVEDQGATFDWTYAWSFLRWLKQHEEYSAVINEQVTKELLCATAIHWSLMGLEHVEATGIRLYSTYLPQKQIVLMKSKQMTQSHQLKILACPSITEDHYTILMPTANLTDNFL